MKVLYGHTDSIYVQVESVDKAKEISMIINDQVRTKFPNVMALEEHPINLEFEKYFESLGVGATKNRNAGLIVWKDGKYLEDKEFFMTGFTAKRISETPLAKEVQIKVLNMWVEQSSKEDILDYLTNMYQNTLNGDIPLNKILKRSRFKEERFHVYCMDCKKAYYLTDTKCNHPLSTAEKRGKGWASAGKRPSVGAGIVGVLMYNELNETPINDTYLFMKVKNSIHSMIHPINNMQFHPNYMAGLIEEDFENFTPDWEHYAQSIVKKATPIFNAMEWDINEITQDVNQTSLDEWW